MSQSEDEAKRVAYLQASTKQCCGQPIVKMPVTLFFHQGKAVTHAMVCLKCRIGFYLFEVQEGDPDQGVAGNA